MARAGRPRQVGACHPPGARVARGWHPGGVRLPPAWRRRPERTRLAESDRI